MSGPMGVLALLLLETAAGGSSLLLASGVWGRVRRGFLLLLGCCVALCAAGAWALVRAGLDPAAAGAGPATTSLAALTAVSTLWLLLIVVAPGLPARLVGVTTAVAGVVALVAVAGVREGAFAAGVVELLLGALFLGSTLFGLLLGHWYLVERRLPKVYMVRAAWWYAAGVIAAAVAAWLSSQNPTPDASGMSPLLAIPGFTVLLAGGLVAVCALIAGFVWKLANEGGRSIQAATGMFYLAVIMAFSAEMSTKLRFF